MPAHGPKAGGHHHHTPTPGLARGGTAGVAAVGREAARSSPAQAARPAAEGRAQPRSWPSVAKAEGGSHSLPRGPSGALGSQRDKGHRKERLGLLLFLFNQVTNIY